MERNKTTTTKATDIENDAVATVNTAKDTVKNALKEIDDSIECLKQAREKIVKCAKAFSSDIENGNCDCVREEPKEANE